MLDPNMIDELVEQCSEMKLDDKLFFTIKSCPPNLVTTLIVTLNQERIRNEKKGYVGINRSGATLKIYCHNY